MQELKDMAEETQTSRPNVPAYSAARSAPGGFFTIRKKGQGYWTRMGTAATAVLVGLLTAQFLYTQLKTSLPLTADQHPRTTLIAALVAGFLLVYGLLLFWLVNRQTSVDFLVATDSEMKKVNWTSRKQLIGSTKVVILFMFLIATVLFVVDLIFGWFFYLIHVLRVSPFNFGGG